MSKPIHLDGTTLEGGGQLVRLALSLSALTKTAINITNIRANRSGGGGLKSQHLTCVQWLGKASSARISGVGLKSKEITFTPSIPKYGISNSNDINTMDWSDIRIQQNTPGSTNLVLQAILPYLLFSNIDNAAATTKIRLRITGGTNVSNSPSLEYLSQVLIPVLSKIGIPPIDITLHSRGWSHGSTRVGSVTYTITPLRTPLPAFDLTERGDVTSVTATIIAPKDTEQYIRDELDVMFERREHRIFGARHPDISITFEDSRHESRYFLLLVATTTTGVKLGRDWLYDRSVRAGQVDKIVSCLVKTVGDAFITEIEHGGCVDEFMRDQLVVFQALAKGRSRVYGGKRKDVLVEPSLHTRTAEWVANRMVGVEFDGAGGCEGLGFSPGGIGEKTVVEGLEKLTIGES